MTRSSALPRNSRSNGRGGFVPHPVPMMFIAAFLVVIAVNGALIFFAQDTFSGLETQHAYERGLQYNQALAAEAAQQSLGWQYEAAVSGEAGGERTLQVHMTDAEGRPLDDLTIDAYLVRPSNAGLDFTVSPRSAGDGRYVATFSLPALGQWDLRLVAHRGDIAWQQSTRLFVK
jgi:nitrogen fixation protein FixH